MPLVDTSTDRRSLLLQGDVPHLGPEELFDYWTNPDLLRRWWPQEAEIEPRPGGEYHLAWPSMGWHLRGRYLTYRPGRELSFTWQWDHTGDAASRLVTVTFEPQGERGTALTIRHRPYTDSDEDQQERQGHVEGWRAFVRKLQDLVAERSEGRIAT